VACSTTHVQIISNLTTGVNLESIYLEWILFCADPPSKIVRLENEAEAQGGIQLANAKNKKTDIETAHR
jgi:hypothetical protein